MARILKLAGLPLDKEPENLKFLMLREYTPDQRRQIVSCAIEEDKRISLVIIVVFVIYFETLTVRENHRMLWET